MTAATAQDDAGVLYVGGRIRTADPASPHAEALATRRGRIIAVGSERDCRVALGFSEPDPGGRDSDAGRTRHDRPGGVVDLKGQALLPGFNDAHLYPMGVCFASYHVDLSAATSITEVLDTLADRARETVLGEWVVGLRLSAHQLQERRLPTISELDAVGLGRAVVLVLRDGHTSIGNSVALATAGIRADRDAPPGGSFGRDRRGRLTGVCHETATGTLLAAVPLPGLDELRPVAKQVLADWAAQGITSLGVVLQTDHEGLAGPAGALESVGMMILAEDMDQGSHAILCGSLSNVVDLRASSSLHRPAENRIVGGIKMYLDGCLESHTAAMRHPYADAADKTGMFTMEPAQAARRMEAAHLAGLQICVHATGDAASARTLELFTELFDRHPPDPANAVRHRVENVSVTDEATAAGLADLGVAAAVQPHFITSKAVWLTDRVGPERTHQAYPFRTLVDAGMTVAGSSDAPMESTDVLAGMAAAVTRAGFEPDQGLTAEEAVALYTRNAAVAQQRDDITGTLAEGKRADLVVLSADPVDVAPEQIAEIQVRRTVIGGRVVYSRSGNADADLF